METYRLTKILLFFFLVVYFLIGMANEYIGEKILNSGTEWYPVFSWDLFSVIPNEQDNFLMSIRYIGSDKYDPPREFRETEDLFVSQGISPTEYAPIIEKLGEAVMRNDKDALAKHLKKIEGIFSGLPYGYDIYEVIYDPVDFWKDGTYKQRELIFSVDGNKS